MSFIWGFSAETAPWGFAHGKPPFLAAAAGCWLMLCFSWISAFVWPDNAAVIGDLAIFVRAMIADQRTDVRLGSTLYAQWMPTAQPFHKTFGAGHRLGIGWASAS